MLGIPMSPPMGLGAYVSQRHVQIEVLDNGFAVNHLNKRRCFATLEAAMSFLDAVAVEIRETIAIAEKQASPQERAATEEMELTAMATRLASMVEAFGETPLGRKILSHLGLDRETWRGDGTEESR